MPTVGLSCCSSCVSRRIVRLRDALPMSTTAAAAVVEAGAYSAGPPRKQSGRTLSQRGRGRVARGALRQRLNECLACPARDDGLVPPQVVVLGPAFVDVAIAHCTISAGHADGAEVDVHARER